MPKTPAILIGTRVTKDEHRLIRVAASLGGENVSGFLKRIAMPAAMRRLHGADKDGFARPALLDPPVKPSDVTPPSRFAGDGATAQEIINVNGKSAR